MCAVGKLACAATQHSGSASLAGFLYSQSSPSWAVGGVFSGEVRDGLHLSGLQPYRRRSKQSPSSRLSPFQRPIAIDSRGQDLHLR
jgi:hypothetical protein